MSFPPLTIDLNFSQAVQQFQPYWLTELLRFVSAGISPVPLSVAGAVVVVGYLMFRQHDRRTIVLIALMTAGNVLTYVLKPIFARPRPDSQLVHILSSETDYSFPSGHAVAVVLLGGMMVMFLQGMAIRRRRFWLVFVAGVMVLVGYSRVYLGVHWLSDVLAGYAVGLGWTLLVRRFGRLIIG